MGRGWNTWTKGTSGKDIISKYIILEEIDAYELSCDSLFLIINQNAASQNVGDHILDRYLLILHSITPYFHAKMYMYDLCRVFVGIL